MSSDLPPLPDFPRVLPATHWPFPPNAECGLVNADVTPIAFTPVPRLRNRRNGWTEETQRLFILALEECGCVTQAARAVGMSARSAYRLMEAEGAESFAEAWDQAVARGIERLREHAMEQAFSGAWVPVYRKGRLVRVELRHNHKLAMALLSGRDHSVAENRERAASRRKYRLYLAERRKEEAAARKKADEVRAAHQAVLDRIEQERLNPPRAEPRVRRI